MQNRILLYIVFLLFSITTLAQYPKEFPQDDAGFWKAYVDFSNQCTREECKEMEEYLSKTFPTTPAYTYLSNIKSLTNQLIIKRAVVYPIIYKYNIYLKSINKTKINSSIVKQNFDVLEQILAQCNPGNLNSFLIYLDYVTELYENNTLYYSKTKQWYASNDFILSIEENEPVMSFNNTTLIGKTDNDSLAILNTSGKYFPLKKQWNGTKGKVTLSRSGFEDANNNYITFDNYNIDFVKAEYEIKDASLTFKPYIPNVLKGVYVDKLLQTKSQSNKYPYFLSDDKNIEFKTEEKALKLIGGFKLEGNNMSSYGTEEEKAKLFLSDKKGRESVEVDAVNFDLKGFKEINVEDAIMKIKLDSNQIIHPFINFRYKADTKEISAYRGTKPLSNQPFSSDYHKMYIFADNFKWSLDSNIIKFGMISLADNVPAIFESYNFYQPNLENRYKGVYEGGPIDLIYQFYESTASTNLDAVGVAGAISASAPYKATEQVFYALMKDGYIKYNASAKIIIVQEKLINQALASKDKQDYDYIRFGSFSKYVNATLNTDNNRLEIYGVDKINLSNKSQVKFFPSSDTIVIDKNRNMTVGGRIIAGKVDFFAKKMDFNYDNYTFKMDKVDSLVVYIPQGEPNEKGEVLLVPSITPIENVSGTLYIAEPDNKSGTRNNLKYPFFTSADSSNVYYDKGKNGDLYDRDKFYYTADAFELDSLTVTQTENLELSGTITTGGIFEPIKNSLTIQKDGSLGSSLKTTDQGLKMYGKDNKYFSALELTKDGLSGKGTFAFGSAKLFADTAFFFLDSVFSQIDSFRIIESEKFGLPQASVEECIMNWSVNKDSAVIEPLNKQKFQLYNDKVQLDGNLIFQNGLLKGVGTVEWQNTKIVSTDITFQDKQFHVKNGQLNMANENGNSLLESDDVDALFDLEKNIADITLNKNDTIPLASFNYEANPKYLKIDLENNTMQLKASSSSSTFFLLSTDITKEGLKFETNLADLNLNDNTIKFGGIKELLLADSKILPNNNEIYIEADGSVRTLQNAVVILNADSAFHQVTNATVHVNSKNDFTANGNYTFKSLDGLVETVKIPEIAVENPFKGNPEYYQMQKDKEDEEQGKKKDKIKKKDIDQSKIYTYAKSTIVEADNFKLNDKVFYTGKFDFDSKHKDIYLDGQVKIKLISTETDWITMRQQLDPKKPTVSMDSVIEQAKEALFTGVIFDKYSAEFYSTILQDKRSPNDAEIFTVRGNMIFSKTEPGVIYFGDDAAFDNNFATTSALKFNEKDNSIKVTGKIGLGLNLYPTHAAAVGDFDFNEKNNQNFRFTADLAVNFGMPYYVLQNILNAFLLADDNLLITSYRKNTLVRRTFGTLTKDSAESKYIMSALYALDSLAKPQSFNYNMVLDGTDFWYDSQDASFKSVTDVSLALMGNEFVRRKYKAYVQLGYSGYSDFITVYLEAKNGQWLLIKFKKGQTGICSSVPEIQNILLNLKDSERVTREGKNVIYEFLPADVYVKESFIYLMQDFNERFKSKLTE